MATTSSFLAVFCGLVISIIGLRLELLTYVGSSQFTTPCRSIQKCFVSLALPFLNKAKLTVNSKIMHYCNGIQDT